MDKSPSKTAHTAQDTGTVHLSTHARNAQQDTGTVHLSTHARARANAPASEKTPPRHPEIAEGEAQDLSFPPTKGEAQDLPSPPTAGKTQDLTPPSPYCILRIEKLACGYSNRPILSDVNLSLSDGEALCLLADTGTVHLSTQQDTGTVHLSAYARTCANAPASEKTPIRHPEIAEGEAQDLSFPPTKGEAQDLSFPPTKGKAQDQDLPSPPTAGKTQDLTRPNPDCILRIEKLACGYSKTARPILSDISLSVATGDTLCLLGPNGAGKTTLFKTMLGLLKPLAGQMSINGENTASWHRRRFAQHIAYIPQDHTPAFPFTVTEVVLQGRTPHIGTLGSIGRADAEVAKAALDSLGIAHLGSRDYTMLSGGERQMVLIARALAQQPAFLVMDEPTASLDFGNQARVLERVRSLAASGIGVIMTTHDPNQALLLGGKVACMGRDGSFTVGEASATVTPALLRKLYGVDVAFAQAEATSGQKLQICAPFI